MTFDCARVDATMMDFLYRELDGETRAAFAAHVGACDRCRAEVEAFERTRHLVRQAPDEPVPSRVRSSVLDAARKAAAEGQGQAAPVKAHAVEAPVRWGDRLRARWVMPSFAFVGAAAALLVVWQTLRDPQAILDRGGEQLGAPTLRQEPPVPKAEAKADVAANRDDGLTKGAQPMEEERAHAPAGVKPVAVHREAATRAAAEPFRAPRRAQGLEAEAAGVRAGAGALGAVAGVAAADESRAAPAAPAAAARAEAPPPAVRDDAPRKAAAAQKELRDGRESESLASLIDRAQKAFAERRFAEAETLYRGLVRSHPNHPDVELWRRRIAACVAAAR